MTDVQPTTDAERQPADAAGRGTPSTRRGLLAGMGAMGAAGFLAACGTASNSSSAVPPPGVGVPQPAGSALGSGDGAQQNGGQQNGGSAQKNGAGGSLLAATGQVPVGGGLITGKTVVTQPQKGVFKAFDTTCPHAGCAVNKVVNGTIDCPCHGSQFSVVDGSVKQGPAQTGLTEKKVKVVGRNILAI